MSHGKKWYGKKKWRQLRKLLLEGDQEKHPQKKLITASQSKTLPRALQDSPLTPTEKSALFRVAQMEKNLRNLK